MNAGIENDKPNNTSNHKYENSFFVIKTRFEIGIL